MHYVTGNIWFSLQHPSHGIGSGAYPNDVATLYWAPFVLNDVIEPISLAMDDNLQNCVMSGWGLLNCKSHQLSFFF